MDEFLCVCGRAREFGCDGLLRNTNAQRHVASQFPAWFIFRCTHFGVLQFPAQFFPSAFHISNCMHPTRVSHNKSRSNTLGVRASQCGNLPNNRVPRASTTRHTVMKFTLYIFCGLRLCEDVERLSWSRRGSCRAPPFIKRLRYFSIRVRSEMKTNGNLFLSIYCQWNISARCVLRCWWHDASSLCKTAGAIFSTLHVYDLKKSNVTCLFSYFLSPVCTDVIFSLINEKPSLLLTLITIFLLQNKLFIEK